MNRQRPPNGIEWTYPYGRPGYTWNPVAGCLHECRWTMPDGTEAICYAKLVAERLAQHAYPQGFAYAYWHPERLSEPVTLSKPAGIFMDSMSDLMGWWVKQEHIDRVLDVCRQTPQHIYFLLTKNPVRLPKFEFPFNVWTGASSPPDFMHDGPLTRQQQSKMLSTSLRALYRTGSRVKWMSFEPLSWNVAEIIADFPGVLNWAVVGAASNGPREFPPDETHLRDLLDVLDALRVPVFFKGNLKSLPWAAQNWRKDFPPESVVTRQ